MKITKLETLSAFIKGKGPLSFSWSENYQTFTIVLEFSHEVISLKKTGKLLWTYLGQGPQSLKYPTDITCYNNTYFLSDRYHQRVIQLSSGGEFLDEIKPGDIKYSEPYGITYLNDEKLLVSNHGTANIHMFNLSDKTTTVIGQSGSDEQYYSSHFFKEKSVYKKWLLDRSRFSTFESAFVASGFEIGNLEHPRGITVMDDGRVVVADLNGYIRAFSQKGEVLQSLYHDGPLQWVEVFDEKVYFNEELCQKIWCWDFDKKNLFVEVDIEIGKFTLTSKTTGYFLSPRSEEIYSFCK